MKKHELLAPAGSLDICKAVIAAGADAVYLGGEKYGARAFAQNFSREEIFGALDFAHLYGRKIYLTVNTLLKNKEQGGELFSYIQSYYERGLDAVIVQDYGVFQFLKKNFPDLPLHVSTQTSVSNVYGAKFFLEQGAARIVPSRELSLPEIRRIYEETGAEMECFVHGALCYSYSGQCLMSSLLGGRSGNRGRCAQPCRLAYEVVDEKETVLHKKETYPLSPKDLNTIEILPKLCEAGIYSFKIEGRMKSLAYAAGVTGVYRRYLDLYERISGERAGRKEGLTRDSGFVHDVDGGEKYAVAEEDLRYLFHLGNRNGFTKGYYEMRSGRAMMALTDSSHASAGAKEVYRPAELGKIPIAGRVEMRVGGPVCFELRAVGKDVLSDEWKSGWRGIVRKENEDGIAVFGAMVSAAQSRPLTEADVRTRFSKTGDTPFEMKHLEVVLDSGCFVPVGQMNELRRRGLALLREELLAQYRRKNANAAFLTQKNNREKPLCLKTEPENPALDVWVSTPEQLETALEFPFVDMVTLEHPLECYRGRIVQAGRRAAFALPYVFRENSSARYDQKEFRERLSAFDLVWARSYDGLGFLLQNVSCGKIAPDDHLYVFSEESADAFRTLGVNGYTASPELNRKELAHMPNARAEIPVYGYAPVMISAQCVYKNYAHCRKCVSKNGKNTDLDLCRTVSDKGEKLKAGSELFLRDRYFKKFFIYRNCEDCYNIIYNSQPLYLLHQADEVKKLGFGSCRIRFTRENADDVRRILSDYKRSFLGGERIKPPENFTTGHFRRGVE